MTISQPLAPDKNEGIPPARRWRISVVVPVYRSEQSLAELARRIGETLSDISDEFELILVNDGSPDGSWTVIERLTTEHAWVRGISLMRNYGQHNALLCGIRAAQHQLIVTMDDDLQHPPEALPDMIRMLDLGFDVVYGAPRERVHSLWRNLMSRLTKLAISLAMGVPGIRDVSAYRVFRSQLRAAFADYQSPTLLLDVLLSWGTTRFATASVGHEPRRQGESNYTGGLLFSQAVLMLTGFSTAPLRLASMIGFGFTLFGVAVLTYTLTMYFLHGSIPGFPFLSSIIAIFSGAQLFALGIIGEYVARIFSRSMERPTYVVAERLSFSEDAR